MIAINYSKIIILIATATKNFITQQEKLINYVN